MASSQYYRTKAEEMRRYARIFHDPWANREFLKLAEDFERLADGIATRRRTDDPDEWHEPKPK